MSDFDRIVLAFQYLASIPRITVSGEPGVKCTSSTSSAVGLTRETSANCASRH